MTRSDWILLFCLTGCVIGFTATLMALVGVASAVPVAVVAAVVIYAGHCGLKWRRDAPLPPIGRLAALASAIRAVASSGSVLLGGVAVVAVVYYGVRWPDRTELTAHSALLIAPLAYYAFACATFIARARPVAAHSAIPGDRGRHSIRQAGD